MTLNKWITLRFLAVPALCLALVLFVRACGKNKTIKHQATARNKAQNDFIHSIPLFKTESLPCTPAKSSSGIN